MFNHLHSACIHTRRIRVLADHLLQLIPPASSLLDVGCGDAQLAFRISTLRPDIQLTGVDVLVRESTPIPVRQFDGLHLPFPDNTFDVVQFVDVLHHAQDPNVLLAEAARVARRYILIKDHTCDGLGAAQTLAFMDYIGNKKHGVALPYNYWAYAKWQKTLEQLNLQVDIWEKQLGLYAFPLNCLFGRSLHFLARVTPTQHKAPLSQAG